MPCKIEAKNGAVCEEVNIVGFKCPRSEYCCPHWKETLVEPTQLAPTPYTPDEE